MADMQESETLRFGRIALQLSEYRLLIDGQVVKLENRPFNVLALLARRAGELVSKQELMDLWSPAYVCEGNLFTAVTAIRKVLREAGGEPSVRIANVPSRGYRLLSMAGAAQVVSAGLPAALPRPSMPASVVPLLGRDQDLQALDALVARHQLVSLVGAGGIGKTLLAQHLTIRRCGLYRQGACWVDLAAVAGETALLDAVANALGLAAESSSSLDRLAAAMAQQELLLVLDNAEHVLAGVAQLVAALLKTSSTLHVMVTSQARLGLHAEQVLRLDALALPPGPVSAEQALAFGSVALFVDRAMAADAKFALSDSNVGLVIDICRALDGLALAIEMAAALVRSRGLDGLAATMHDRLRGSKAAGPVDAASRQSTLKAALDWSHELLDPRERVVFRRLSVLAGSTSLELLQALAADPKAKPALDRYEVLEALDVLVDRSLVAVDDQARPRYQLLETPKAYALGRLKAEPGEHDAMQRRLAEVMAAQIDAQWAAPEDGLMPFDQWRQAAWADLDNAREAFAWARQAGQAVTALQIGAFLLKAVPRSMVGERLALASHCQMLLAPAVPEPLRLRVCVELSRVWSRVKPALGQAAARQAVAHAREEASLGGDGWPLYMALAAQVLALGAMPSASAAEARTLVDELQGLEQRHWPAQRLVWGAEAQAVAATLAGDDAGHLRALRRALVLVRQAGNSGEAQQQRLIEAQVAMGDASDMETAATDGLDLIKDLVQGHDDFTIYNVSLTVISALLAQADCPQARVLARSGWSHAARFDLQLPWLDHLAWMLAQENRHADAAYLIGCADARYDAKGQMRDRASARASAMARRLAAEALGDAAFEQLCRKGQHLNDADIERRAFGADAVPPMAPVVR